MTTHAQTHTTNCCIVGGGPAGIMLGFLLARKGVEVTVLEKWPDFFRDFRGDTIHPSTMELLHELGLLDEFLNLPHQKSYKLGGIFNDEEIVLADFAHLNVHEPYVAFMPQWDFLNFIAENAGQYPNFTLMMNTEMTDLVHEDGRVVGVRAKHNKEDDIEIRANLVVGTDGRSSRVREKSGLQNMTTSVPIDVLWFPIPRKQSDPTFSLGHMRAGQFMVTIERDTYWQCGYVIPKGAFERMKSRPIENFHDDIRTLIQLDDDRFRFITHWDDIRMLSVTIDHMPTWHASGVLCIGDAAHAMSPIGGVGINLAVQDAVAAARILEPSLRLNKPVPSDTLAAVQKRRSFPARLIQRIQGVLQNRVITPILEADELDKPAFIFRLLQWFPFLRRIPAYFIGVGIRPEHIRE